MTIHFTPGEANVPLTSHDQTQWRNHKIVAYGLGNNLIIYTESDGHRMSLQTVYLPTDLVAISVNGQNGLMALACGTFVYIFRPVNEYMTIPKWTEATRIDCDGSPVNCVHWAPLEGELAVGTCQGLFLYGVTTDFALATLELRWKQLQPASVDALDISPDGARLITYTTRHFDSFARVWMRLGYGAVASLFDLVYAAHEPQNYVVHGRWRVKPAPTKVDATKPDAWAAMAHIKNIRSFMPALAPTADDNDVLYTVTNDQMLHVWATCEFNGHSFLKQWAHYDLTELTDGEYVSFLVLDSVCAREIWKNIENADSAHILDENMCPDYLLVVGTQLTHLVKIDGVTANPPNSIVFRPVCSFPTDPKCIPSYTPKNVAVNESTLEEIEEFDETVGESTKQIQVNDFLTKNFPVACTNPMVLSESPNTISFLVHDRIKGTLRSVVLSFNTSPRLLLVEKFQGHGKSVKKLYTSSSSHEGNIMLSLLGFPYHNYIWEPLPLDTSGRLSMAITKRFCLNVTRNTHEDLHHQGIENAILLNDVYPAQNSTRHHLAVVFERGGFLSVWDCDGATMDDKDVGIVSRIHAHKFRHTYPQAFFLKTISPQVYVIVAIYEPSCVEAWRIDVPKNSGAISCKEISANNLPGEYTGFTRIAAVDTFLEKDITLIDECGVLRSISVDFDEDTETICWSQSLHIHTNIQNASWVHGASLVGKLAIVDELGTTLYIWDSKTGVLEYEEVFPLEYGPVKDLDWTFLGSIGSTANILLSVGFSRFVLLYTQLRYDYTNKVSTFVALKKIDISDYSSHVIGDLIWLDDSYLVISSGNQFFIDDKWVQLGDGAAALSNNSINSTIRQLLVGYKSEDSKYPIADLVRILNGPLPVYHPQFLIQALLMDETELVESILVKLLKVLRADSATTWNLDLLLIDLMALKKRENTRKKALLDTSPSALVDIFDSFNSNVADLLSEKLTSISLPLLTRHQQTTLRNIVILVNKLSPLKKSLDPNGMKFMYGFELFQSSHKLKKLPIRDINWAVHSDQKEMLFSSIENHYHRLTWNAVKEVGLAYWVDVHRLRTTMESAARNEFADERDPSGKVSILYLAINKKQVLLGLWRTVFHPEKDKVVKFLSNNFSEQRWKSAALKNAFVLLGKHRYMDAAYFFLLAGKVKDCCMTLCSKVQEFDLALAVARVNSDDDAVRTVLEQYILPEALEKGDRWTTSWVFWEMKLKEISVQALVMPPIDVVTRNADHFSESFRKEIPKFDIKTKSKSFLRVDPALGVLYQNLRSSKLKYLQGSKDVLPEVEFEFVVRLATIYSRMGCDYLSLLLLRNWEFLNYSHVSKKKEEHTDSNAFLEFAGVAKQQKLAPEPSTFEEPDMSAFSFGF